MCIGCRYQRYAIETEMNVPFIFLLKIVLLIAGLKTALVEGDDFASGTSSRSTKLIHGGVRYLQKAILGVSNMHL